jgi:hypothetical protein
VEKKKIFGCFKFGGTLKTPKDTTTVNEKQIHRAEAREKKREGVDGNMGKKKKKKLSNLVT